jgi:hypothetical protein
LNTERKTEKIALGLSLHSSKKLGKLPNWQKKLEFHIARTDLEPIQLSWWGCIPRSLGKDLTPFLLENSITNPRLIQEWNLGLGKQILGIHTSIELYKELLAGHHKFRGKHAWLIDSTNRQNAILLRKFTNVILVVFLIYCQRFYDFCYFLNRVNKFCCCPWCNILLDEWIDDVACQLFQHLYFATLLLETVWNYIPLLLKTDDSRLMFFHISLEIFLNVQLSCILSKQVIRG